MIQTHRNNILTYCRHRVMNAIAEGLNSKIMAIKRRPVAIEIKSISKPPSIPLAGDSASTNAKPGRIKYFFKIITFRVRKAQYG
jgi:hypothetical protein